MLPQSEESLDNVNLQTNCQQRANGFRHFRVFPVSKANSDKYKGKDIIGEFDQVKIH